MKCYHPLVGSYKNQGMTSLLVLLYFFGGFRKNSLAKTHHEHLYHFFHVISTMNMFCSTIFPRKTSFVSASKAMPMFWLNPQSQPVLSTKPSRSLGKVSTHDMWKPPVVVVVGVVVVCFFSGSWRPKPQQLLGCPGLGFVHVFGWLLKFNEIHGIHRVYTLKGLL